MNRIAIALLLALAATALAKDEPKKQTYPTGSTLQKHSGLEFQLQVPNDYDASKKYSLYIVLHGMGDSGPNLAPSFRELPARGYIVVCPSARSTGWTLRDVEDVKSIVTHLLEVYSIPEGKLHGLGFSNGGWNLGPLVFDEKLPFVSACWMAAGFQGGKVPPRAKKAMGAIALAGAQDGNRGAAEKTVDLLKDKVRSVECRIQPNLGHKFTRELMPYYYWWLDVMDGRYEPGLDMSFPWKESLDGVAAESEAKKTGAFLWFISKKDDAESAEAKRVQQEVFFDHLVRVFGSRVLPVKLEREKHAELFAKYRLKSTPAIVVLDKKGKKKKVLEGKKIKASSLAKALRSVARDQSIPK
jgi:predicted esterase